MFYDRSPAGPAARYLPYVSRGGGGRRRGGTYVPGARQDFRHVPGRSPWGRAHRHVVQGAAGAQEVLVQGDPERFFRPPYVGVHGWIGVRLEGDVDWDEVAALVEDAYRMTAPKRLIAQLG